MWSWKYRRPQFAGAWRANSTFPITSHLDKNVELHILVRGGIELTERLEVLEAHSAPTMLLDTHPRTRASEEPRDHRQE